MVKHIPGTKWMSTVVSDGVLAAVSGYCGLMVWPHVPLGALGLWTISVAASFGAARFAGVREAAGPHDKLSILGATAGMLLLAAGFGLAPRDFTQTMTVAAVIYAIGVVCQVLFKQKPKLEEPVILVLGFSFIGASLYRCVMGQLWGGVAGTVIFAAAGLIGIDGHIQGIRKVDIFHFGMAAGLFLVSQALLQVW